MNSVLFLVVSISGLSSVQCNFLALNESKRPASHRMGAQDVALSLNASIEQVMGEHSAAAARRVAAIEKSISHTFQALPKNSVGRLAPPSVRYLVHNYFAKEHGWLLAGLEGQYIQVQGNASDVHEASILQEMAPALVESMLEARQHGRGLSFEDVVVMVAAVERLCVQESISLLSSSYWLNQLSAAGSLDEGGLHEVLRSYLIIFRQAAHANLEDYTAHVDFKQRMEQYSYAWSGMMEYETDAVMNMQFANRHKTNPFKPAEFSFDMASEIVESLAHDYGTWSNSDCVEMKDHLMTLDHHGTGRVPLDRFYNQPDTSLYHFHESEEYLRSIGALDEHSRQVLIANYVVGPTNCVAQSAYYSVCCLNECESLMNELEGNVQAPTASAEQLLRLVSQLSSSTVDAPRQLSSSLQAKLHEVAERHDGDVHLHGRLFAQWLHFAFPNDCPYPMQTSAAALTPSQWWNGAAMASGEEKEKHMNAPGVELPTADESLAQWSDDEMLPLLDDKHRSDGPLAAFRVALGWAARLLPVVVLLRFAYSAWQTAKRVHRGEDDKKDFVQFI